MFERISLKGVREIMLTSKNWVINGVYKIKVKKMNNIIE